MTGVVVFQDREGLLFYPVGEIASLTPEFRGRWRAVTSEGAVVHRPDFPSEFSGCRLGESRVNPHLLRSTPNGWMDPADFLYKGELTGDFQAPPTPPDLKFIALRVEAEGVAFWVTGGGEVPYTGSLQDVATQHPHLIPAGKNWWFNPYRLRGLRRQEHRYSVELADGRELTVLNKSSAHSLVSAFGLTNPDFLGAERCLLSARRLRDYPVELEQAPAELLKSWFQSERPALANIIYQTVRLRQQGYPLEGYGAGHSSYLYKPVYSIMVRAGFWESDRVLRMDPTLRTAFEVVINDLVGRDALFTYQELGFEDDPSFRRIGDRRPEVLVVFEKTGFRRYAEELSRRFGVSYLITAGTPKLLSSEFLALALSKVVQGPIRIISFTDYDPAGWMIPQALAAQLTRYGMRVTEPVEYLVRAEHFTPQELELFSFECAMGSASLKTAALEWVKASGGIDGLPRGIHANHFQPVERVARELEKLL